jgi:hypothetical protein
MYKDRINELRNRYFEGTTTGEEEKELMNYFVQEEEVPKEWMQEQQFFRQLAMAHDTNPPVPAGLEERLSQKIDAWAESEKRVSPTLNPTRNRRRWWIAGIAASLLLAGSIGMKLIQTTEVKDTHAELTPEMALIETERALLLLSSTLNKGMEQMYIAQQTTHKVQENINKALNQIN